MKSFEVSFDYRCPFAKNIHLHVITALRAGAEFDVVFAPWTLSQGHRVEGSADVWDNPDYDEDLVALAAGVSVRDLQPHLFLDAHEALFRARHERAIRLNTFEEVTHVLEPLGVDMAAVAQDISSRRPHQVIAQSHQRYSNFEAFGVPTFIVGQDATFVRYMKPPSDDAQASIDLLDSLVNLMASQPELNEFKHTKLPH
ncbi:MAG: protein-disulfide isomerase [Acidimicrobiaceae bacterium]|nr:protein-disulfide isomerase [Acidimicrobiaceae bacterium]